ncbi:MAG: hypothetical protein MUE74_01340 [Bacteroidales bacterium]|jgi:hypothetical protein|nr:hypothetical protein [Bacteroidales bacterium]
MALKILRGTILGGIAYFLLGWLVYGVLLMDFFSARINQCANKPDGEMIWWAMIVSNLALALLLTLILNWKKAAGIVDGLVTGAIFGALFTIMMDFSFWSMTTMYGSISTILVEIVVSAALYGVIGMVIVLTWGRK